MAIRSDPLPIVDLATIELWLRRRELALEIEEAQLALDRLRLEADKKEVRRIERKWKKTGRMPLKRARIHV
jgi:hypothetical protein